MEMAFMTKIQLIGQNPLAVEKPVHKFKERNTLVILFSIYLVSRIVAVKNSNIVERKSNALDETSIRRSQQIPQGIWKDIFSTWTFKTKFQSLEDLGVTFSQMMKKVHKRSSERIQRVLAKVSQGKTIRTIVIGGSNSVGAGIPNINEVYYNVFTDWWNKAVKPETGSLLINTNLALGGTGSDFYAFCLDNFNASDNIDVVFVELSVTDFPHTSELELVYKKAIYGKAVRPLELLTRRLLNVPSAPAVFYVNLVVADPVSNPKCLCLVHLGQSELEEFYQITSFSWVDLVCPSNGTQRLYKITPNMISKDGTHMGIKGHAQLAWMMIKYFQSIFVQVYTSGYINVQPTSYVLPKPLYISPSQAASTVSCCTWITPNYRKPTTYHSLQVVVKPKNGFIFYNSNQSRLDFKSKRADAFAHWGAGKVGNWIEFYLNIPAYQVLSGTIIGMIVRTSGVGGALLVCTVPNLPGITCKNRFGWKRFNNQFGFKRTRIYPILGNIQTRNYRVVVQIVNNGDIHISGFVVGPNEGLLYNVLNET